MSSFAALTTLQLKRALAIKEQIVQLEDELKSVLGGAVVVSADPTPQLSAPKARRGRRGNMSPEARERIAAAQRARWAKVKGTPSGSPKPARAKRKGRTFSPEARAKMAEAARRRWAAKKA